MKFTLSPEIEVLVLSCFQANQNRIEHGQFEMEGARSRWYLSRQRMSALDSLQVHDDDRPRRDASIFFGSERQCNIYIANNPEIANNAIDVSSRNPMQVQARKRAIRNVVGKYEVHRQIGKSSVHESATLVRRSGREHRNICSPDCSKDRITMYFPMFHDLICLYPMKNRLDF